MHLRVDEAGAGGDAGQSGEGSVHYVGHVEAAVLAIGEEHPAEAGERGGEVRVEQRVGSLHRPMVSVYVAH